MLVATFVLTVVFDLVVAIAVGMIMACVLFMKRMSEEAEIHGWKYALDESDNDPAALDLREIPHEVRVYEITGPMFFGVANLISGITVKDFTKVLIIRMRGVPAIDATAMQSLESLVDKCKEQNVSVVFSHVNDQPRQVMEKDGLVAKVGTENFCPHIDAALARASKILEG